jgi:hypothetical protein
VRHAPALVTQEHLPSGMSLLLPSLTNEIPMVPCVYLCSQGASIISYELMSLKPCQRDTHCSILTYLESLC